MDIQAQEYSVKEKDGLEFKRIKSNTVLDENEGNRNISKKFLRILRNGMIYIREFGIVLQEMKGRLLTYQISKSMNDVAEYKEIESWKCRLTDQVNFLVSDKYNYVRIMTPQKEFNFGKKEQLLSDIPQIRIRDPDFKTYKNICLYRSLKFEEFVVVG